MISVTKLRSGTTFEEGGKPYRVLKYEHTHLSRGSGTIKIKARNLKDGSVVNLSFKSGAMIEDIEVIRKKMQFLYPDGEDLVFMDPVSFEQVNLAKKIVGEQEKFLVEGEEVQVLFWDEKILDLDLPPNLVYRVAETDPGVKGNSATNVYKPAKLANGLMVKVPLFVQVGESVKVDTRTGEYVERVS